VGCCALGGGLAVQWEEMLVCARGCEETEWEGRSPTADCDARGEEEFL